MSESFEKGFNFGLKPILIYLLENFDGTNLWWKKNTKIANWPQYIHCIFELEVWFQKQNLVKAAINQPVLGCLSSQGGAELGTQL